MQTLLVIVGSLVFLCFSMAKFLATNPGEKRILRIQRTFQLRTRYSVDVPSFFQTFGFIWFVSGILFLTGIVHYPEGKLGLVFDVILLLVPVWSFGIYLDSKSKGGGK